MTKGLPGGGGGSITPWLSLVHEHGFLLTALVGQLACSVRKHDDTQRVTVPLSHRSIQKGLLLVCKNLKILMRLFLKRKSPGLLINYEFETAFSEKVSYCKPEGETRAGEGSGATYPGETLPNSGNPQRH